MTAALQAAEAPAPEAPDLVPLPVPPSELIEVGNNVLLLFAQRHPVDVVSPTPTRLALAALGFGTLFGATALSAPLVAMPWVAATGVCTALGAGMLTAPALLILHQFLGLNAKPVQVFALLSRGFADAGGIALGLTPFVLMLSLTSRLALPATLLCCAGLGGLALLLTHRRLIGLEQQHQDSTLKHGLLMLCLTSGWAVLAALISARIALGFLTAGL